MAVKLALFFKKKPVGPTFYLSYPLSLPLAAAGHHISRRGRHLWPPTVAPPAALPRAIADSTCRISKRVLVAAEGVALEAEDVVAEA